MTARAARTARPRAARPARAAATAALAALLALGAASCTPGAPSPSGTTAAQPGTGSYTSPDGSVQAWAPEDRDRPVTIAGTDFTGAQIDTADWLGDVVVLNTWYAACPPCRAEAPDLVALAADYADDGVRVLGINGTDDAGAALAFERTFAVTYPSLDDRGGTAIAALQGVVPIQATPTTLVLDRAGNVAVRVLGTIDPSVLRPLLDDVLAEQA